MTKNPAAETHSWIVDLFAMNLSDPVGHLFIRTREEARQVVRNWNSAIIAVSSPRREPGNAD
jgi:hypothetical protein